MTASKRVQNARSIKYHNNIHKRGSVELGTKAKDQENKLPVGPLVLGFIVFVVLGSSILQIIQTATSSPKPQ